MQALDQAPFRISASSPRSRRSWPSRAPATSAPSSSRIAEKVIVVIAPGGYLADPARYPYRRLRPGVRLRPLGPDSASPPA